MWLRRSLKGNGPQDINSYHSYLLIITLGESASTKLRYRLDIGTHRICLKQTLCTRVKGILRAKPNRTLNQTYISA